MIMKLRNLFVGAVAAVFALAGCQEKEQNLGTPDISISANELTFDVEGGEQALTVNATRDWKVETDADWVVVDPAKGEASADDQTVTVTVLENTGMDRSADLKFTIGMKSKYLTVSQAGPGGSAEALIVYYNDYDKVEAEKTYGSGSSWPYLDQFDGWMNQTGTGAANVEYAYNGMSARANSTSDSSYSDYAGSGKNNMFFGSAAYFSTNNIALNGATGLTLTFGTEKYSQDNGSVFTNSEYKIFLSNDGAKWVEFTDYTFAGGTTEGRWNIATANFTVPEGTENLSICMQVTVASSYRMDDMKLVISEGGTVVDFSAGVAKDFGSGSGSNPGTGDLPDGTGEGTLESPYDAAKATKVASALADGETKAGVYVKGIVKSFKDVSGIAQYGNISYYITDADGAANFYVFRGKYLDNAKFTSEDQLKIGDEVVVYGDLVNYMGNTPELAQGNYIVSLNSSTGGGEDLPIENKTATVKEFLAAEVSTNVFYQVTGTIVSIESINSEYQNATFTMQDETGSLYVYRMKEETDEDIENLGLTVGDELTVKGNRGDYNGNPQMVNGVYVSHVDKEAPVDNYNASIVFSQCGYSNGQSVADVEIKIDDNLTVVFSKGTANNAPAYYDSGSAVRMYQNGAIMDIKAANGKTIKEIQLTFGSNMYYLAADSGELSAENAVRVWKGSANSIRFTATGTDSSHRAYVSAIKVAYE